METSLTINYDKQWLNCVSGIGPQYLKKTCSIELNWIGYCINFLDIGSNLLFEVENEVHKSCCLEIYYQVAII